MKSKGQFSFMFIQASASRVGITILGITKWQVKKLHKIWWYQKKRQHLHCIVGWIFFSSFHLLDWVGTSNPPCILDTWDVYNIISIIIIIVTIITIDQCNHRELSKSWIAGWGKKIFMQTSSGLLLSCFLSQATSLCYSCYVLCTYSYTRHEGARGYMGIRSIMAVFFWCANAGSPEGLMQLHALNNDRP